MVNTRRSLFEHIYCRSFIKRQNSSSFWVKKVSDDRLVLLEFLVWLNEEGSYWDNFYVDV